MSSENKKMVLIIEDDIPLMKAIMKKLRLNNYDVITVNSTAEGKAALGFRKVDAIWLDHYLVGNETGFDFVREVKKNKDWKDIPIFIVSNTANELFISAYMNLGITKYFVKSDTRLDTIVETLKQTLEKEK